MSYIVRNLPRGMKARWSTADEVIKSAVHRTGTDAMHVGQLVRALAPGERVTVPSCGEKGFSECEVTRETRHVGFPGD